MSGVSASLIGGSMEPIPALAAAEQAGAQAVGESTGRAFALQEQPAGIESVSEPLPGSADLKARYAERVDAKPEVETQVEMPSWLGPFREPLEKLSKLDSQSMTPQEMQRRLLGIQAEVHMINFQVEAAGKLVEHGTSGTRTLLQTQA